MARELFEKLQHRWNVSWDMTGAIGRRYRRADEVGVPFCVTVDFETVEEDGAVTVRDRDSTEQVRIPMDEVIPHLKRAFGLREAVGVAAGPAEAEGDED